jgi:hypothetical protein
VLFAMAAYAAGAVALADGDAQRGLLALQQALHSWQELEAPYEAARTRVLLSEAFRALNDPESAALELAAARDAFVRLDARPDLARVDVLAGAYSHRWTWTHRARGTSASPRCGW